MVRVPERDRNKCERVTGPQPERVRSIFAGVNATRTSGTGPERDRNANRNRCEHGLSVSCYNIANRDGVLGYCLLLRFTDILYV